MLNTDLRAELKTIVHIIITACILNFGLMDTRHSEAGFLGTDPHSSATVRRYLVFAIFAKCGQTMHMTLPGK